MRKKPDFIVKGQPGYREKVVSRPFKWAPGIPSLAIRFEELPLKEPQQMQQQPEENVDGFLESQAGFYLMAESGLNLKGQQY